MANEDDAMGEGGELLPASPCIRHCCLDDADICLGCGRHIDEITGWHAADADGRRAILERARRRREQRQPDPFAAPGPRAFRPDD